jgi:DNA-binding MarR family transcriptional regulator
MKGGRVFGIVLLVIIIAMVLLGMQYNRKLQQERSQIIAGLATLPGQEQCRYDDTTCPQAIDTVVFPELSTYGLILLGVLLVAYLIRNDTTQRQILAEMGGKREQLSTGERTELILSVLTVDERKIINAVRQQPGISQATLRLRTDLSKAKLSLLLKDLEKRGLVRRVESGKTNEVHLKVQLG